jgi:hypothetical protein
MDVFDTRLAGKATFSFPICAPEALGTIDRAVMWPQATSESYRFQSKRNSSASAEKNNSQHNGSTGLRSGTLRGGHHSARVERISPVGAITLKWQTSVLVPGGSLDHSEDRGGNERCPANEAQEVPKSPPPPPGAHMFAGILHLQRHV